MRYNHNEIRVIYVNICVHIKNNISSKWKLFTGLYDTCDPYDIPKNDSISTNIIKYSNEEQGQEDWEQQQKEDKIIDDDSLEIITPSQALRKNIAEYYKVKGTIKSITKPFKMVNIRKLSNSESYQINNEWLQKCDSLSRRRLDFNPKDKIKNDFKHVGSYFPPGFKKIKIDTAYSDLYQILKNKGVII